MSSHFQFHIVICVGDPRGIFHVAPVHAVEIRFNCFPVRTMGEWL